LAFAGAPQGKLAVPWSAFGFIGVVLFNSRRWLPQPVVAAMTELDTALLAMAMAWYATATSGGKLTPRKSELSTDRRGVFRRTESRSSTDAGSITRGAGLLLLA